MRRGLLGLPLLVALLAAGCASSAGDPARRAAERFTGAVGGEDTATACALLAETARHRLEAATQQACPVALARLPIPHDAPAASQAWGDGAQVRTGADTVFLREIDSTWLVTAAGCRPTGEQQPYECVVGGP